MTAPISVKYEYWVAVIDDANKAQERVKKLEAALQVYANRENWGQTYPDIFLLNVDDMQNTMKPWDIARKALEE